MAQQPRAIRNNNPGNIVYDPKNPIDWVGAKTHQPGEKFVHFDTPQHGMRAMALVLINKYKEGKANTVTDLISSYESNRKLNNVPAYINAVLNGTNIKKGQQLNLIKDPAQLKSIMKAMVYHESGVSGHFANLYDGAIKSALKGSVPTNPLTSKQKTGQKAKPSNYTNSPASFYVDMSVIRNLEEQMSQTNEAKYCFVNQCFAFNLQELLLQYSALANNYNAEYR